MAVENFVNYVNATEGYEPLPLHQPMTVDTATLQQLLALDAPYNPNANY